MNKHHLTSISNWRTWIIAWYLGNIPEHFFYYISSLFVTEIIHLAFSKSQKNFNASKQWKIDTSKSPNKQCLKTLKNNCISNKRSSQTPNKGNENNTRNTFDSVLKSHFLFSRENRLLGSEPNTSSSLSLKAYLWLQIRGRRSSWLIQSSIATSKVKNSVDRVAPGNELREGPMLRGSDFPTGPLRFTVEPDEIDDEGPVPKRLGGRAAIIGAVNQLRNRSQWLQSHYWKRRRRKKVQRERGREGGEGKSEWERSSWRMRNVVWCGVDESWR